MKIIRVLPLLSCLLITGCDKPEAPRYTFHNSSHSSYDVIIDQKQGKVYKVNTGVSPAPHWIDSCIDLNEIKKCEPEH